MSHVPGKNFWTLIEPLKAFMEKLVRLLANFKLSNLFYLKEIVIDD